MDKHQTTKIFSAIGMVVAWLLMILLIFALDNTMGNLLKSLTYGLAVGNTILASYVCKKVWKKSK